MPLHPDQGGGAAAAASSRPLRIAFVYDALFPYQKGGAERRYFELVERLKRHHDVHYFTWNHWGGEPVIESESVTLHAVGRPRPMYGPDGKRTVREAAAFTAAILPALARERFDVVDCSATPYLPVYGCWAGTRLSRTPMVATWHEYWGEHWGEYLPRRPILSRAARLLERVAVRLSDSPVAVSDFTAARLPRRLAGVVENGIAAAAAPVASTLRDRDVVFVGRLIDDKRVDVLLDAMRLVCDALPATTCDIIGDGPARPVLEAQAARLGLGANVAFHGHAPQSTVQATLSAARVFAFPSIREGFGISVVEAQAMGVVPVVARAPHSAAWTLVDDGVSGLVRAPEPAAFAAAIAELLADRPRHARMSEAARANARRYDWDAIAARMEDIYRFAAADAPASRLAGLWAPAARRFARAGQP